MNLNDILNIPPYSLDKEAKRLLLNERLQVLTLQIKKLQKHFRSGRETGCFIWKDCDISTKNYGLFLMHILRMKNVQS